MAAGNDPERFWKITPREIDRQMRARTRRFEIEHAERAWLAWHVAALSKTAKMPKLKDFLNLKGDKRVQTIEDQLSIAQRWHAVANRKPK